MENKMNLVEILKDCPKGMELDCTISNDVVFEKIEFGSTRYPVVVRKLDTGISIFLTKYGQYVDDKGYKCVIFPKGKTTWEGFVPPCQFKNGDVITCTNSACSFVAIFKEMNTDTTFRRYVSLTLDDVQQFWTKEGWADFRNPRLATEEEKAELFDAIKANGYKWNEETKTLEKLVEPTFKVGDKVRFKNDKTVITITGIKGNYYLIQYYNTSKCNYQNEKISFNDQDKYELVPDKFDINTLVPFESRVLVRNVYGDLWKPAIYGFPHSKGCYVVGGVYWGQCIPYEENKELLGTTNNLEEYGSR